LYKQKQGQIEFAKRRGDVSGGTFRFYPLWSLNELQEARPILNQQLTMDEVTQRFRGVGGVPRHVFSDDTEYSDAIRFQDEQINVMTGEQAWKLANDVLGPEQTRTETLTLHYFSLPDEPSVQMS
jgi:hypothetical protein